jgi:hypothetical protein
VKIVELDIFIPLLLRQASEAFEPANKNTFLDISFHRQTKSNPITDLDRP